MKSKEEVVKEMQLVVEQMRLDDIEENPDCEHEFFNCDACGETKDLAGSVLYGHHRLCNDCVLLAEVGFELGQIKDILANENIFAINLVEAGLSEKIENMFKEMLKEGAVRDTLHKYVEML